MKSPFTGGNATLKNEYRTLVFRKEPFEILFRYYQCDDTGEEFTTDDQDRVNVNQVQNKYREKYGIPFPDEIREIRNQYGLPANKMAEVLGLGVNVYRNYESGEVPSVSNGRLIQMVKDPTEFKKLLSYSKFEFDSEDLERINNKIATALSGWDVFRNIFEVSMLGEKRPNIYNGYRVANLEKIFLMVLFFAEKVQPFKTKLNKLLFYADFLHFKKTCFSISGLMYKAIPKGPVPVHYEWIFEQSCEHRYVMIVLKDFRDHYGEQFISTGQKEFDEALFETTELEALNQVCTYFWMANAAEIINKSHQEDAWKDNIEHYSLISYEKGFQLKYPENVE